MALATRCPHCRTTFKVAHDQLKLRAGLVRCGACKQIFNGIEHLLRLEEPGAPVAPSSPSSSVLPPQAVEPSTQPPPEAVAAPDKDESAKVGAGTSEEAVPAPNQSRETPAEASETGKNETASVAMPATASETADTHDATDPIDPLQRMTLMDFTHIADDFAAYETAPDATVDYDPDAPDPLEQAIDDLQRKPLRGTERPSSRIEQSEADAADAGYEEPNFVKQGRRRQRVGRVLHILMGIGSFVLVIGFLAQGIYIFRDEIATRFPEAKPALVQACALLDCRIGLPARIEAVTIESSELQALTADQTVFALSALLRNHGSTAQAWPNIELTLNDANEKPIARRVFVPRDYLAPGQDSNKGFASGSEQPIRLSFALSQLKASGYRVYLFYP